MSRPPAPRSARPVALDEPSLPPNIDPNPHRLVEGYLPIAIDRHSPHRYHRNSKSKWISWGAISRSMTTSSSSVTAEERSLANLPRTGLHRCKPTTDSALSNPAALKKHPPGNRWCANSTEYMTDSQLPGTFGRVPQRLVPESCRSGAVLGFVLNHIM
jgi:hypothetical protein